MKNKYTLLLFLLITTLNWGQKTSPKSSKINKVTVYLDGASVERSATVATYTGENVLIFNNLSPDIDESSIQVSGLNNASISSINFNVDFLEKKQVSEEYKSLENTLDHLLFQKNSLENTLIGLQEELTLLKKNQKINSDATDLSLEKVKEMSAYYRTRTTEIGKESYAIDLEVNKLSKEIEKHRIELEKLNSSKKEARGEITIKLNSTKTESLDIRLKYNITTAGWFPSYDIRAKEVGKPLAVSYKANVYQQSGSDWENITVVLSTGDPSTNNIKPILPTKYLNFTTKRYTANYPIRSSVYKYNPTISKVTGKITDETGYPLPGVNIIESGTSNGTQSDFDGNYNLAINNGRELAYSYVGYQTLNYPVYGSTIDVQMKPSEDVLNEVVVTGYAIKKEKNSYGYYNRFEADKKREDLEYELQGKAAGVSINNESRLLETGNFKETGITNTQFEIKDFQNIRSNSEITVIEIDKFNLPANYKHYVAPELNENVFLTATATNWEKFDLLQGEGNVYFEDAYAGKTIINPQATTDSLVISLGIDPNVIVKRERLDNFKKSSFLGTNRIIENGYKIEIKNNKKTSIQLVVEDRIPISQNKAIKVNDISTSDANFDNEKGLLKWNIRLAPNETLKKEFSYTLKYPKNKRITL